MSWDITMVAFHVGLLAALCFLWHGSPGHMQRLVLGLLIASAMLFITFWTGKVAGYFMPWQFKAIAHQVEHIALTLYVLRLFVADQERRCLSNSSARSRSSQR